MTFAGNVSNLATRVAQEFNALRASLADVATSGSYDDLSDKPTIPSAYTDEQVRDVVAATLVQGSNVTITVDDPADTITIAASASGAQTVNYFQPLVTQTFTASAGSSQTFTLSEASFGVQIVFLNGQQLQPSEYSSPSSTSVTVTPAEGALVATDRVTIVFARSAVFAGSFSQDISVTDAAKGVVLKDRVNGNSYRLFMSGGVLGSELV